MTLYDSAVIYYVALHLNSLPDAPTLHSLLECLRAPVPIAQSPPETSDMVSNSPKQPLQNQTTEYVQERTQQQSENPFAALIPDQAIAIIPSFTLESGVTLHNIPLAYSTRGQLSPNRDNAMVICHALTGSADVSDWWGPLLGGPGRAFDISRFFVICMNSLGSPYGSASPVTCKDGNPQKERYGPEFPLTTIRDDVK